MMLKQVSQAGRAMRGVQGRIVRVALAGTLAWGLVCAPGAQAEQVDRAAGAGDLMAQFKGLEADAQASQASVQRGRKVASFCANCHGTNGTSTLAEVPNLGGQNSLYLLEQMQRFVDGRRKDPFMGGMIRAMTQTERMDAVMFFANQKVAAAAVEGSPQLAHGRTLYNQVCFRCHGEQGLGSALFPRLAGQQKAYVVKSLKRYRDGTGERIEPLMAANTRNLSDDDISALALYVGTLGGH
jgi:cytochrome c553